MLEGGDGMITKRLRPHAVYTDVVNGHLLPEKERYGMEDFKALVKDGWARVDARWIVICTALYYHGDETDEVNELLGGDFLNSCARKDAADERKAEGKLDKECDRLTEKALMLYCSERGIPADSTLHCLMRASVHNMIQADGLEATRKMVDGGTVRP